MGSGPGDRYSGCSHPAFAFSLLSASWECKRCLRESGEVPMEHLQCSACSMSLCWPCVQALGRPIEGRVLLTRVFADRVRRGQDSLVNHGSRERDLSAMSMSRAHVPKGMPP